MQYQFGSGNLFGLVLAGGVLVPRKFAALQDVSIDFAFTMKELYGQNQFPLAIARGQGKITGKAKAANINAGHYNDIFFGQANTTGQKLAVIGEAGNIGLTPFQVTVANSATFFEDMGVVFTVTGVPLTRVAAAPTTGQYTVAAGVYTFAAADTNLAVLIDYTFTPASGGLTTTINNLLSGTTPTFVGVFPISYTMQNGVKKTLYVRLNSCYSSKLTLATKIDDFLIPEFDFSAGADVSGIVGTVTSTE
jgi:hypothetical protein